MVSQARDIALRADGGLPLEVSKSPVGYFHHTSPSSYGGAAGVARTPTGTHATGRQTKQIKAFASEDVKILLLENVNVTGRDALEKQGYQVEFHKASMGEDELIEKIRLVVPSNLQFRDPI